MTTDFTYEYKSGVIMQDGEDLEISTLLSIHDVAAIIGVHHCTIRRWVHADKLDAFKFGDGETATLRFRASDIDKLLLQKLKKNAKKKSKDERATR